MSEAQAEIQQLFSSLAKVWEQNDLSKLEELYTTDSDYVTFDGSWLRGVEENRRVHSELFHGVLAGARLVGEIEQIRMLNDDTAVVISKGALLWPWHKEIPARRLSRQTMVVVRTEGRWKIASFQNTRIHPMPPLSSPLMRLFSAFIRWRVSRWRGPR